VAQEAFNNVIRHSGAHNIDLELRREGAELLLQVTDDGRGFEPGASDPGNGLGLYSIGERVHAVGGTVQVDSAPGGGTTIRVAVPVREVLDA
jgi:signal transduction histidine kinase